MSTTGADLTGSCTTQNFDFKAYDTAADPYHKTSIVLSPDNSNLITLGSGENGANGAYCRMDFWNAATGAHRNSGTSTAAENSINDIICKYPALYPDGVGGNMKVSLVY